MAKKRKKRRSWSLPDAMWQRMEPLLPHYRKIPQGGRPRCNLRKIANGIFYVLRTGCQWKASPQEYGSGSSLHRYFQEWETAGVFRKLWKEALLEYDELKGIQWNWQSVGRKNRSAKKNPRFKARRWVVERTHSWINRFRRLLVRWEKKTDNYLAMLHLSFAWNTLSSARVLG